MTPIGSIDPRSSQDPKDPDYEKEVQLQSSGFEIGIISAILILVFSLLIYSDYADKKDKDLRLHDVPPQVQSMERK